MLCLSWMRVASSFHCLLWWSSIKFDVPVKMENEQGMASSVRKLFTLASMCVLGHINQVLNAGVLAIRKI